MSSSLLCCVVVAVLFLTTSFYYHNLMTHSAVVVLRAKSLGQPLVDLRLHNRLVVLDHQWWQHCLWELHHHGPNTSKTMNLTVWRSLWSTETFTLSRRPFGAFEVKWSKMSQNGHLGRNPIGLIEELAVKKGQSHVKCLQIDVFDCFHQFWRPAVRSEVTG